MFCFVRYLSAEQIVTENIVFHSPLETTFFAPMVMMLEYEVAASRVTLAAHPDRVRESSTDMRTVYNIITAVR